MMEGSNKDYSGGKQNRKQKNNRANQENQIWFLEKINKIDKL